MLKVGRPREIDREALHRLLWLRTDRRKTIKFKQSVLALEVGVSYAYFSRIVGEMVDQGRLELISIGFQHINTYRVTDPEVWTAQRLQEMADSGW